VGEGDLTPGSSEIGEKIGAGCPQLLASVTIAEEGLLHSNGTARCWPWHVRRKLCHDLRRTGVEMGQPLLPREALTGHRRRDHRAR
jgi:hypothetical protein